MSAAGVERPGSGVGTALGIELVGCDVNTPVGVSVGTGVGGGVGGCVVSGMGDGSRVGLIVGIGDGACGSKTKTKWSATTQPSQHQTCSLAATEPLRLLSWLCYL